MVLLPVLEGYAGNGFAAAFALPRHFQFSRDPDLNLNFADAAFAWLFCCDFAVEVALNLSRINLRTKLIHKVSVPLFS